MQNVLAQSPPVPQEAPSEAVPRQTPLVQLPLAHWSEASHASAPSLWGTHRPSLQYVPWTHAWSLEQPVGHDSVPAHRYGAHVGPSCPAASGAHVPCVVHAAHPPVHVLSQHTPLTQYPLPHAAPEAHGLPFAGPYPST